MKPTEDQIVLAILALSRSTTDVPSTGEIAQHLGCSVRAVTVAAEREFSRPYVPAQGVSEGNRIEPTTVYRDVENVKGFGNFCGVTSRKRKGWQLSYRYLLRLARGESKLPVVEEVK